jgi:hypothetical protein
MASHGSNQNDDEQQPAPATDGGADSFSFGLDALGELFAQDQQPSLAPADGADTAPEGGDQPPAADSVPRTVTLESALDWYKDWLNSL